MLLNLTKEVLTMKFFVNTIDAHSSKANIVNLTFVDTNTLLDGCKIYIYAPKSVELVENAFNDLPYFLASNAFCGYTYCDNLKHLQKQVSAKAPAGKKRKYKAMVSVILTEVSKLNVEVPVEERGNFVGQSGDKMILKLKPVQLLSNNTYVDEYRWIQKDSEANPGFANWVHPEYTYYKYKLVDENDNCFILSTTSERFAEQLNVTDEFVVIECTIKGHKVFRSERQTLIGKGKFV
jgi:hypothetical protein